MPDWVGITAKLLDFFKLLGVSIQKSPKETTINKNRVTNIGGTVNQYFIVANGPLATKRQREQFQRMIQGKPYSIESLDLIKKKALITGTKDKTNSNLVDFIAKSLPAKDHALWEAGLLLRQHFTRGENELVAEIKQDMMSTDPIRGKNIANLCNAGYLEDEIIPMHKALTDLERSEDFIKFYEALVTQTPTSVFVGMSHNERIIKEELFRKIKYATNYSAPYVKVHALGRHHVELAKEILKEVRKLDYVEDVFYADSLSHLDATIALRLKT